MEVSRRLLAVLAAASLMAAMALSSVASATVTTDGTWVSYPAQTFTTSTSTTTGTAYQSAVRAPINPDGSSNWPAKRGVIAVQFDLLTAPTTITTTTKTYDPPVWESIGSDSDTSNNYSFAALKLNPKLTLNDITNLSATYQFTKGDCYGGSLRWDLFDPNIVDGDGSTAPIKVYYGDPRNVSPSFQSCSGDYEESGKNLMDMSDATLPVYRFEIGNTGVYVTWDDVLAATNNGADQINRVQLTLDSGWKSDQAADVSNVTVNDNTWVPLTTESQSSSTTGDFAPTCDLPQAELRWAKNDSTPTGGVNEASSIQPKDTGQFYRQVDCKYIYNLDVSSLDGAGTYTVWVRIDGTNIQVPAHFDLR